MIPTDLTDLEGNGEWTGVIDWPLIAIHSMVLPDGRVLSYGTNENGTQSGQFVYALWDYTTNTGVALDQVTATDLFCSNMALDSYLQLTLMIGGDEEPLGYAAYGVDDVNVFDHTTDTIAPADTGDMSGARWYPAVVTMGSGEILALGGKDGFGMGVENAGDGNTTVEVYRSGIGWDTLENLNPDISHSGKWWYPTTWQRSDGEVVFFEGTSGAGGGDYYVMDVSGEGTMTHLGTAPFNYSVQTPSISYRTDKGLMMDNAGRVWSVDFSTDNITFEQVFDLGEQRRDVEFVLLADGRVAIVGGSIRHNVLEEANKTLITWDPDTGVVTEHEDETLARLYHSSALLLPDGTLISMGGGAPGPLVNTNAEIWAPDYLFGADGTLADRLEIDAAEIPLQAGDRFILTVEDTSQLTKITALKNGASTHSKNHDARFLELEFTILDGNTVEVALPENGNVIIPGTWMVFAFDQSGVPSHSEMIDVLPGNPLGEGVAGHYSFGTSTYQLGTAGLTWEEAQAEAAALGGKLVEIDSQEENDFILNTFFRDNPIWLGFTDVATEGVFLDQDGNPLDYTNWTEVTATNRNDTHNYVIMTAPDGTWRASKVGPAPAVFDADGRPAGAPAISIIEFDNVRDIIAQTGDLDLRARGSDDWFQVTFDAAMDDPIVVISPPTKNGGSPITVRVQNVTEYGFEVHIDEWDYLDGRHATETLSWTAVERGVHVMSDGAVLEAGSSLVGSDPTAVELQGDYGTDSPVIIAQVASAHDSSAVTDRVSGVDTDGFTLQLQSEEADTDGHIPEEVHWISFDLGNHMDFSAFNHNTLTGTGTVDLTRASTGSVILADLQTLAESDAATLRILSSDDTSMVVQVQEEVSADREIAHGEETLGWVSLNETIYSTGDPTAVVPPPPELVLQTGEATLRTLNQDDWFSISYDAPMSDPIVVISPPTKIGGAPVTVRVRNVTETGFEIQLDEWDYLDGRHAFETISWMAVERGVHELADGSVIEAGSGLVSSDWSTINFSHDFGENAPVVLGQVASTNEASAVNDRINAVTGNGFDVRLQEQESDRSGHAAEEFHWVSFDSGTHENFSALGGARINDVGADLDLTLAGSGSNFFADMQSYLGADPAVLRVLDQTDSTVRLQVQEERSANIETAHAREYVGWVMVDDFIYL